MGIFFIPKDIVFDDLDGEAVAINTSTGAYYSFTPEAAAIMKSADRGIEVEGDNGVSVTAVLLSEGLLGSDSPFSVSAGSTSEAFEKFTDMQSLLLADPIHDVDEQGWPKIK